MATPHGGCNNGENLTKSSTLIYRLVLSQRSFVASCEFQACVVRLAAAAAASGRLNDECLIKSATPVWPACWRYAPPSVDCWSGPSRNAPRRAAGTTGKSVLRWFVIRLVDRVHCAASPPLPCLYTSCSSHCRRVTFEHWILLLYNHTFSLTAPFEVVVLQRII